MLLDLIERWPCHANLLLVQVPLPSAPPDNTGQFVQTENAGVVFIGSQTSSSLFLKKTLVVESLDPRLPPPSLPYCSHQTEGSGKE